eukprot:CAMPEP_0194065668 /NCGR_PEP_ID=MMETSP0009_2-20130614/85591_1 /TAXON_ID=210454 /ORGANISM="Grammatophora oceanica, Strain CCMP 410" /LENGTH=515 /DNA_ID=CAMNT_0038718537 /DNA_START=147 /DNA_END=1696 /DNA_ORIENTATION=+
MPTKVQQEKKDQAQKAVKESIKHLKKQVPNEEVRDKMVLRGNNSTSKVKDSGYGEHKANVEFAKLFDTFAAQFASALSNTDIRLLLQLARRFYQRQYFVFLSLIPTIMPTKVQQEKKAQAKETIATSMEDLAKQVPNEEERNKMVLCGNASTSKVKDSGYGEHKANVELAKLLDAFGAQFTEAKESIERARIRDKLSALVKRKKMRLCYYDEERKKWINYPEHPINEANTKLLQLLKAWKPKEAVADSSSNNKKSSGSNSTKQKSTPSNSGGNATASFPLWLLVPKDYPSKVKDSGYGEHKANVEFAKLFDTFAAQFVATPKESIERIEIRDALCDRIKGKGLRLCYYGEDVKGLPKWIVQSDPEIRARMLQLLKAWKPKAAAANNKKSRSSSSSTKQKSTPSNSGGNATAVLPSLATPSNDDDGGMDTEGVSNNISAIEDSKMHATVDSPLRKKQKTSPTTDETKELEKENKALKKEVEALKKRCKALEDGNSMPTEKREASDAGRPDNIISGP